MRQIALLTFTFVMAILTVGIAVHSYDSKSKQKIDIDDIGEQIELVGRLGYPLGTMLDIEGEWSYPDQSGGPTKDYSMRFHATTVNGKHLKSSVSFDFGDIDVRNRQNQNLVPKYEELATLNGKKWKLRGFESGEYRNTPNEYYLEQGSGPPAVVWHPAFVSKLFCLNKNQ